MNTGWRSTHTFIILVMLCFFWSACQQDESKAVGQTDEALAAEGSTNGAAGQTAAYHDGELFTVNMKELSDTASATMIENDPSLNEIYAYSDLDEQQDFVAVIDAIQGAGFNPLWRQVLIVFNEGFAPRQFVSEDEVEAAAAGANPEITLVETDEVYRCSVVAGDGEARATNQSNVVPIDM